MLGLRSAAEKSLARCRVDKFDLLLLHNPDAAGYTTDAVWQGNDVNCPQPSSGHWR